MKREAILIVLLGTLLALLAGHFGSEPRAHGAIGINGAPMPRSK